VNKLLFILVFCLLIVKASATNFFSGNEKKLYQIIKDTSVVDEKKEDTVIAAIAQSKTAPKQDNVKYVSQVTKYGFKNLFSNYTYNPALPYTAQINPNAESFMQDYIKAHSTNLQKMKGWGLPYFNLIESILQQYGLPKELKYIAVIESSLQSNVVSTKGACGPWQLMPGTAKTLGLTINPYVDERTDYYKSTQAASKYLLQLYSQLHDWLLVMAAYNGGLGRVSDAIKKSGSTDFWKLQFYLPEESRTYVKRFLATQYIMEGDGSADQPTDSLHCNSVSLYNVDPNLSPQEFADLQKLTISGRYNSTVIAKNITMSISDFNRYNPYFDKIIATNGTFDLRLPSAKMQLFQTNKYPILGECMQNLLTGACIPTYTPPPAPPKRSKSQKHKH
jgi:membrane-bound lytic murein transglycosylase D